MAKLNTVTPFQLMIPAALVYTLLQPFNVPFSVYILPLAALGAFSFLSGKGRVLQFGGLLFFLIFSMGIYRYSVFAYLPFPVQECVRLKGELIEEPSWNSRGNLNFTVAAEEIEHISGAAAEGRGRFRVTLPSRSAFSPESWLRGDTLDLEGRFSPDGALFFGKTVLEYTSASPGHIRRRIVSRVHEKGESLSPVSASLLPALVLGLKNPDQNRITGIFRQTGTAHIIALSGFHSGLVAFLLYFLFKKAFGDRAALVLSGLGLLFYLYLAGPKPSLVRSVMMYELILFCKLRYIRPDLKKVLAASFLLSALICPASLHTLSARLSYLALWGILSGSGPVGDMLPRRIPSGLRTALGASAAAQIWTLPLVLFSFGVWYPAGLAASLVLTPLVTLYMYTGILYLFLPDMPYLTVLPELFCRLLENLMVYSAGFFMKFPSLSMTEPGPGLFLFLLFPLLLGVIYRPGGYRGKRKSGPELRLSV